MNMLEAISLGLVQGLTEFLPVSSSGHLVIFQHYVTSLEAPLLFDLMLHAGTLLAVLIFFRKRLLDLTLSVTRDLTSEQAAANRKLVLLLIIGTIPAGIAGVLWEDSLEVLFGNYQAAAGFLILTGAILLIGDLSREGKVDLTTLSYMSAVLIGCGQALALVPGISRSGSTICVAILVGCRREIAAEFSFLLAIPAIVGAVVLKLPDLVEVIAKESRMFLYYFSGTVIAAIVGYVSILLLLTIVKKRRLVIFSAYCWLVALVVLVWG